MPSFLHTLTSPFHPPLQTLRHYSLYKLRRDLLAGLTVSVVEVPQSMAYAIIAGVPPQYGIYTSIIQGIVGALLSSSEHMTTGPTNTQALLVASAMAHFQGLNPDQYLQLVFLLTLLKGLFQLAFFAARMGDLVKYVSKSVITGLTAGAGILIITGQLPHFLGISAPPVPHQAYGVVGTLQRLLPNLPHTNFHALTLGLVCLAIVLLCQRLSKFIPGSLIAVALAAATIFFAGRWLPHVPVIGQLPTGFVHFAIPPFSFENFRELAGGALALAILGMIESVAIAKSIAAHTGERISANQEFFAQGFKNTLTSFFQCIPGSGSFTRSALDYAAGAQTRFAAVFNALFVAAIFFLFHDVAAYIPNAALAAILFVVAFSLIDLPYLARILRTSRTDAAVCAATFLATLLAPLEYAIFIGVFLNIALYMHATSRLHISQIIPTSEGLFRETAFTDRSHNQRVLLLQLEGNLYFGLADELHDQLTHIAQQLTLRVIILRLKRTHQMDASILSVLEKFILESHALHKHILLCGVPPALLTRLHSFGLTSLLPPENIFPASTARLFDSVRLALHRAESLIGSPLDLSPSPSPPETFSYDI